MLLIAILLTLAAVAAAALTAAAETAVMLLPAGRVHRLVESRVAGATSLDLLLERRNRLRGVSAIVSGASYALAGVTGYFSLIAAVSDLIGSAGTPVIASPLARNALGFAGIALAVALVHSLAQALPRTLAASNPERVGLASARFALLVVSAIHPLTRVLTSPWRWTAELLGGDGALTPWAVTPEWRGNGDREAAEREEVEEALLEAVSDFAEKVAREVMVPRTDVAALPDTATVSEAIAMIKKTGFSRLPVFHESIDNVRGVLYAKDLLVALGRGDSEPTVAHIARTPFFVPETKPVEELMFEMRTKTHIAIVADEYGGTSGIVTLEDLLEEIVGEISDEYDREEPLLVDLGEGSYRVDARLPVGELNELLGMDLDTDADSVGGLFTEVAGRIPELGESMELEGLRFTVTDRQGTRVRQLTVEPVKPRAEGESRA